MKGREDKGASASGPGCEPTASAAQEGVFAESHPSRITLAHEDRDRPSMHGLILGEALADIAKAGRSGVSDFPEMCATCAFRPGCMTNMMGGTQRAALDVLMGIEGDAFACHHGLKDGEPTKLCAGWLAAQRAPFDVVKAAILTAKARMDAATGPDEIRTNFDAWIATVDPHNQMDDYQRGRAFLRDSDAALRRPVGAEAEGQQRGPQSGIAQPPEDSPLQARERGEGGVKVRATLRATMPLGKARANLRCLGPSGECQAQECETCNGTGQLIRYGSQTLCPYDDTVPCSECDGTGESGR